uniref:Uncharacterized protein n=1 Tax=Rhizophora mucronata TaxID=61149 RepID=A0A2P2QCM2_RHIMU
MHQLVASFTNFVVNKQEFSIHQANIIQLQCWLNTVGVSEKNMINNDNIVTIIHLIIFHVIQLYNTYL